MELVALRHLTLKTLGWQKIDITSAVRRWFKDLREPLQLLVDCSGCSHLVQILWHGFGFEASYRPFLVIDTEPIQTHRVRRRALDCTALNSQHCCRQQLRISFKELGWDKWILAPSGYDANYCTGECSVFNRTPDQMAHYHSFILEEFRKVTPLEDMIPCCAPSKWSSTSLIYFDEDLNIIKRDLPKMVVEECGCTWICLNSYKYRIFFRQLLKWGNQSFHKKRSIHEKDILSLIISFFVNFIQIHSSTSQIYRNKYLI